MFYSKKDSQWLFNAGDVTSKLNAFDFMRKMDEAILAGSTLVFSISDRKVLMFQTIDTISPGLVTDLSLAGYEPGSIIYFPGIRSKRTPVFRLRDCRLPTEYEMKFYLRNSTV